MIVISASVSMPLPSLREAERSWRARSLCTWTLAEDGDGHRLVVQLRTMRRRVRGHFTIRIKSGEGGLCTEDVLDGLDLLADALAEQQFSPDAAYQHRDPVAGLGQRCLVRSIGRSFDQAIKIAPHELSGERLRHV